MKPVSPPLSSTRLSRLIYLLALVTALLAAYYSYRMTQWKSEVGGWWNLVLRTHPSQHPYADARNPGGLNPKGRGREKHRDSESVEDRINGLAQALGMPPADLASAIAVAARQYVPPASLSSVASEESGPAVQAMLMGATDERLGHEQAHATGVAEQVSGVMGGVVSGMESFVGMEEP